MPVLSYVVLVTRTPIIYVVKMSNLKPSNRSYDYLGEGDDDGLFAE